MANPACFDYSQDLSAALQTAHLALVTVSLALPLFGSLFAVHFLQRSQGTTF